MAYSQLLLFYRILWDAETALFWQNLWVDPLIYPYIERYRSSYDLPSEEASVSYPECILWAIVCPVSYYALIGMSHKLPSTWHR